MKLFRNTISLINRSRLKDTWPAVHRFYSDEKIVSNETISTPTIQKENTTDNKIYRADRAEYDAAIENDFATGITISSYNVCGFRLNRYVQCIGPIIVFPRTVFSWNIECVDDITSDSLSIFSVVQPKVDTVIIGTGELETTTNIGKNLLEIAQKHKVNLEILTTELACTQFNYLIAEGRMVAAALIPPRAIRDGDDDAFGTLSFDNKLFSIESMVTPGLKNVIK